MCASAAVPSSPQEKRDNGLGQISYLAGLAIVVAVAVFLRLYRIDELPPGLYHDEGVYGLHSLSIYIGDLRLYYGEREPLFMYWTALLFRVFGISATTLRVSAAVVGIAASLTTALAGSSMFGRRTGLLAGAIMATGLWPMMVSRDGFRAGTLPLVETASLWMLWEGWKRDSRWRLVAGGALLGLTLYTYIASRVFPAAVVALVAWQALTRRPRSVEGWQRLALAGVSAVVAALPITYYFVRHPGTFTGRPAQVSALDPETGTVGAAGELATNALKVAGMFLVAGDSNWRHNLPGTPAFVLPVALLMLIGLGLSIWRWRLPAHLFLVIWLPAALAPSVLAVDAPHYLRTIGAAPCAAILGGVGFDAALSWLTRLLDGRLLEGRRAPVATWIWRAGFAAALLPGIWSFYAYQVLWASRVETYEAYNYDIAIAGQYLAGSEAWRLHTQPVYVTDTFRADRASMVFFLWPYLSPPDQRNWFESSLGVKWFDEKTSTLIPVSGQALVITSADTVARRHVEAAGGKGELMRSGPLSLPTIGHYTMPADGLAWGSAPIAVGSDGLDLVGTVRPPATPAGEVATLGLIWRVSGPGKTTPSVFCQLLAANGVTLAQDDHVFGYEVSQWSPGERVVTWHQLKLPVGLPPGSYQAEVGLYDKTTGKRQVLRLGDRTDSKVVVGPVAVQRGAPGASVEPRTRVGRELAPGLTLVGADVGAQQAAPGVRVPVTLYWRSSGGLPPYELSLHIRGSSGTFPPLSAPTLVDLTGATPYPNAEWQAGELVRGDVGLRVDPATPAGDYDVVARVYSAPAAYTSPDRATGEAVVGTLKVAGVPRVLEQPAVKSSISARFADVAELVGYDVPDAPVRAGQSLEVTLVWKALGEAPVDYSGFVHVVGSGERIVGQNDGAPDGGRRPTSGWVVGEYVVDRRRVEVRADAPPGEYAIAVGLYDPGTGRRLPVVSASGVVDQDRLFLPAKLRVVE